MSADPRSSELWLSPYCKLRLRQPRPRAMALVFSPVGDRPGRFSLENALRQANVDTLLLNVPERGYYLQGILGLGTDLEASLANLRRLIAEIGAAEVAAIGLSMGGYGAVLLGALLGVDRVLAMGGETLLRLPGSRSRTNIGDRFDPSHPDLRPQIEAAGGTRFHFLCGEQDLIDLYSAWRVRDLPNVQIHPVRNAPHEIARWLSARKALGSFLSGFAERGAIDEPCLDRGTAMAAEAGVGDLYAAQDAFLSGDLVGAAQRAEAAATALPDVALAQFQCGQALERIGRRDEAAVRLRAAVALDPAAVVYRVTLARVLVALDQCAEGGPLLDTALAEAPRLALAHHVRGNLLARSGDLAGAVAAQQQAMAIDPGNASFPSALGQAHLALGAPDQALEAFRSAVALNPQQGYLHYLLGRACAALGLVDQARHAFGQALQLSPGNSVFRQALSELRQAA